MAKQRMTEEECRRDALRKANEAAALLGRGEAEKASHLLREAAEVLPDHPGVLLNLGGAYVLLGRFTEAEAILTRASELAPNDPMVWSNLGAAVLRVPVLSNDECRRRAIDAFRKALELDRHAPNVAYHLGLVYKLREEWQEAARCFQMALETNPQDKDALNLRNRMQKKAAADNGGERDDPAPPGEPAS